MGAVAAAGWGTLGASSLLLGAWLAVHLRPAARTVGLVLGFGAGALLGAIAYELIPSGSGLGPWGFAALGAGAMTFFLLDRAMTGRHQSNGASIGKSIMLGALLDGIPESLVLGMGVAAGGKVSIAFLVAVFVSNLPEALGATAAMRRTGTAPPQIYRIWAAIVAVSAACAALGYGVIQLIPRADGAYMKVFAAGAVLVMLSDSMMPEAFREGGRVTGLVTVLGFAVAGALTVLE